MNLSARLDPSNRQWSDGSVEYIRATVTRSDGDLDNADVTGIGLSNYDDDPTVWLAPVGAMHSDTANAVTVRLLIGTSVQPSGRLWVWLRVQRDGETVYRCCRNAALDFTDNEWGPPTPGGLVFGDDGTLSGPGLIDNGDGSYSPLIDHGDGTYDLGVAA